MLKWKRDALNAGYETRTDTHRYVISRNGKGWFLTIQRLTETAGVKHAMGQPIEASSWDDTRTLGYAVANAYNDLGDGYQQHEHGGRSRMTEAIQVAYAVTP